jgi:pimeloyl-ACP methyl ester carboxylesterase
MATTSLLRTGLLRAFFLAVTVFPSALVVQDQDPANPSDTAAATQSEPILPSAAPPRRITISYRAHDGHMRAAIVLLPHGYGPKNNPPIPLIISPHGRGVDGAMNSRLWRNLPTIGSFAVINPDGEGRVLPLHSWGAPGQIADLARMPRIVRNALPWLRLDSKRIYAVGGSMGGQETLLLVARFPKLLAGAVAVDSVTDFPRQYRNFPHLQCDSRCLAAWGPIGLNMQRLARREFGGTPATAPAAYAARSPLAQAKDIARSCVPLQIWWSRADKIVMESPKQSGALFGAVRQINPQAPVDEYVGSWIHTHALNAHTRLPMMLAGLGLLPKEFVAEHPGLRHRSVASPAERCAKR